MAGRRGSVVVDRDEHPRADTSLEALADLRPILGAQRSPTRRSPRATSSARNDAAAACIVTTPARARGTRSGLTPCSARVVGRWPASNPLRLGVGTGARHRASPPRCGHPTSQISTSSNSTRRSPCRCSPCLRRLGPRRRRRPTANPTSGGISDRPSDRRRRGAHPRRTLARRARTALGGRPTP